MHENSFSKRKINGVLAYSIWFLGALFVVYKFVSQTSYAILNIQIAKTLSLTIAEMGFLGSAYTFAFAAITLPSGVLLDRYGARKVLTVAALIVTLGIFFLTYATSFWMVFIGQVLLGLGGAFGFGGAGYLSKHWFSPRMFGIMFGLVQTLCCLTSMYAQKWLGMAVEVMSWQKILLWSGVFGIGLVVLMGLIIRDPDEIIEKSKEQSSMEGLFLALKEVLVSRQIWFIVVPGAVTFGVVLSIGVFWGVKILDMRGFSRDVAVSINAVIWLGLAIGAPLVGVLANRLQSYTKPLFILTFSMLITVLALFYLPTISEGVATLLFFLIGFFSAAQMICFTMSAEMNRAEVAGTAISLVNMMMFITSGVMMWLPAKLIDNSKELTLDMLTESLAVLPISLVFGTVIIAFIKDVFRVKEVNTGSKKEKDDRSTLVSSCQES